MTHLAPRPFSPLPRVEGVFFPRAGRRHRSGGGNFIVRANGIIFGVEPTHVFMLNGYPVNSSAYSTSLRNTWPALLLLAMLALLPVGRGASEALLGIAAIAGLVLAWRQRHELVADPGLRLAAGLFACFWLPALISAPDSVNPAKSWSTVRDLLRFLPFVVFACLTLRSAVLWPRIVQGIAAIVVLWLLDAWVQAFTGYSIAGLAEKERLSGIFGAGNLKLGPVLAVLSPFVLSAAGAVFGRRGLIVAFVFLLIPILLAGSRAAWLTYALVAMIFVWREAGTPLRFVGWSAAAVALVAIAAFAALHDSQAFDARIERTLRALQGSSQAVDDASAGRVRIWTTAARMAKAHPVNGVGVRAFRYAYAQYAGPNDYFVNPKANDEGALHAHQIVLEVLTETGVIGLLFWIAGAWLALQAWWRASAVARARAFAPGLALVAMTFPLNTHLAFYSAWWGLLFWWLLALYCAALFANEAEMSDVA
jgi:O-antigen ligase